jgi:hypothetical protein
MCGGAIISELIPESNHRHRAGSKRSLCTADFWPHADAAFDDPKTDQGLYPDLTGACTFPPDHQGNKRAILRHAIPAGARVPSNIFRR